MRKIIHIDMDAFYASVEQLDQPELKGKPIAVGGNADRGVIAAASYEARKFGIRSAMSSRVAARLCPELIFVKPRFDRYKAISRQIHDIFHRYTDIIEPLALDEAYLDVTENKLDLNSGTLIAQSIKNDIRSELNLIASAGVSYNKFLAKLASDQDKPNGLFIITPDQALDFIHQLPIDRFHGVGKTTADRLRELQIFQGKDLLRYSKEDLNQYFGKLGNYLYNVARGIDERPVRHDRERKSIAAETTLHRDLFDAASITAVAQDMLRTLWKRYEGYGKNGRTLSLKLKYHDFTVSSKSKTIADALLTFSELQELADELLHEVLPVPKPIRLLGFQIANFEGTDEVKQLRLFK